MRQIQFIQGNVISLEYTVDEYVRNVPGQKLKVFHQIITFKLRYKMRYI